MIYSFITFQILIYNFCLFQNSFSLQKIRSNTVDQNKNFENFYRKRLSLKCSYLLGAGSGRPLIWLKRCANVCSFILDRFLGGAGWSRVRNRHVFDQNSVLDENHKFFSKIFVFKILLAKVHTCYTDQFLFIYCVSKISISQGIHSII